MTATAASLTDLSRPGLPDSDHGILDRSAVIVQVGRRYRVTWSDRSTRVRTLKEAHRLCKYLGREPVVVL